MRFERCEVEGPAPGTSELAAHLNCRNKSLTFIKPDLRKRTHQDNLIIRQIAVQTARRSLSAPL